MQNKKKILNRLAGSSAILVTALSVGVPVQSAFANQTVEAQNQAGDGLSFAGRTVVDKIVNTQTGSNNPDADGSYNSQIKDISIVSTDGNKVRYRINFKDGFTIPKDGYVHFFMESAHQFANATDLYMGKTNVARLANGNVTGTSKEFADSLKAETTLAGFRDKLEKAPSSDVFGTSEWKVIFNENFEKLNKDRYVEFVVGSYEESFNERKLPFLYVEGLDKAKLFSDDTIIKKYENKVILPSVSDKAIAAPYNKLRYPIADTTAKLVDNPTYTSNAIFNLTTNPGSTKKLPIYLADANYGTGFIIKSVAGDVEPERVIERNKVNGQSFFLKKGDKLSMSVPSRSKRVLDIKTNLKVGDVVEGAKVEIFSRPNKDGNRFTDSEIYEKDRPLTNKEVPVTLKVSKVSESGIEYEIMTDVPMENNTFSRFIFDKTNAGMSVELRENWLDEYGADRLKDFLTSTRTVDSLSVKDGFGFNLKLSRDGKDLGSFDRNVTLTRNTNLAFGESSKGTVKVKFVDEKTGEEIPGNPVEIVAKDKLWYESVTIKPKQISGYNYVSANGPLSTIVGSGEQTVTLKYKKTTPEKPVTDDTDPKDKDPKEVTTTFKDDKGNIIKTEKGTKDKEDIPGYKYIKTEKDKDGNTIHTYHKITTKHIGNKDGKDIVLKEEDGDKPKSTFPGYEYQEKKVDPKTGDVTHLYKAEKPKETPKEDPKEVTTTFKDDKGNIIKTEKGTKDKEDIPGYKYIKTEKDKDGNTIHTYHKITTKHIGNKDGKDIVLKEEDGDKPKSTFPGYEYQEKKVDPKTGDVTHLYKVEKPKEAPKETPKEVTTTFKDDKGNIIKTEKGPKDKEDIPGYKYIRTEKDKDGNTTHIYHKIVTRHVENKDGKVNVLKEEDGNQPKSTFPGYDFVETKVNPENGDVTHYYKATPEAPAETPKEDITTFFKDDKGNVIKTEKGPKDKEDIPGYKYLRTEKDKDGNTIHIYHKIVTRHVENKDGKVIVLKEEEGDKPKSTFKGYDFVETKVDPENGDVTHHYKANTQTPDKKDAVKTGANASSIVTPLAILAGLGAVGAAAYFVKRKRNSK